MRQNLMRATMSLGFIFFAAGALPAEAAEHEIGSLLTINGLQVQGVYLQPVEMEPAMADQDATKTDIHLETDIHGGQKNPNGFAVDAWIPYLKIDYKLTKKGTSWSTSGTLMPMVASDGPHYGANVKLDGSGAYSVVFHIQPPSVNGFMRHTDKETGVGPWWKPFDYKGDFNFAGTGKKGGY